MGHHHQLEAEQPAARGPAAVPGVGVVQVLPLVRAPRAAQEAVPLVLARPTQRRRAVPADPVQRAVPADLVQEAAAGLAVTEADQQASFQIEALLAVALQVFYRLCT